MIAVLGAVCCAALAGGLWFYKGGTGPEISRTPEPKTAVESQVRGVSRATATSAETHYSTSKKSGNGRLSFTAEVEEGLAAQLEAEWTVSNSIEAARNATVSIVSPWGSGSGFFVDDTGTIITNRHVIQFDQKQLQRLVDQAASLKKQLDNERNNIRLTKKQLGSIRDREVKDQVRANLRLREEQYAQYHRVYEDLRQRIETIEQGDFLNSGKVILIDGSEYQPGSLELSENSDLAKISIHVYNSPYIRYAAASEYPDQGKTVYTIGSPSGLSHTITSGIISGYRELDGEKYIQTDAPINPGNSGGPLINEQGKVLGVNTMILRNTEGIGFAVPFSTVRGEFPGTGSAL